MFLQEVHRGQWWRSSSGAHTLGLIPICKGVGAGIEVMIQMPGKVVSRNLASEVKAEKQKWVLYRRQSQTTNMDTPAGWPYGANA